MKLLLIGLSHKTTPIEIRERLSLPPVALRSALTHITVANRTYEKTEQLAQAWNGRASTFQQLPGLLRTADIVITSTGAPHIVLGPDLLGLIMESRANQPLFL